MPGESRSTINMVANALDVLLTLYKEGPELGVTELGNRLGLPKSTVHRLLSTLQAKGFVQKTPDNGKYALGLALFELGMFVGDRLDVKKVSKPWAEKLVQKYNEVVHLAVLDNRRVILVDKTMPETQKPMMLLFHMCLSSPPHATALGKTLLAYSPPAAVDEYIEKEGLEKLTPQTISDPVELKKELQAIREQGYAVCMEGFEVGMSCVGGPIRNYAGEVIAALSISAPTVRITSRFPDLIRDIKDATSEISKQLGYKGSDSGPARRVASSG